MNQSSKITPSAITKVDLRSLNPPSHFASCTVTHIPISSELQSRSMIPLGFIFQPLAKVPRGYPEIPITNFVKDPLVRCKSCYAYINAFVKWECKQERWFCNLCGKLNNTPPYFLKMTEAIGPHKRNDQIDHPELSCGSYEAFTSTDYINKPPQSPSFMFLIDVSANAIKVGLVEAACQSIKDFLFTEEFKHLSKINIGIITFDSSIHFYNISNSNSQPQILVIPTTDVFVPFPGETMISAKTFLKKIQFLLDQLPLIWKDNTVEDTCLGSAIEASYIAMKNTGGKLNVFFTSLPTIGKLPLVGNTFISFQKTENSSKVKQHILKPLDDSYKKVGDELGKSQISADLYVCPCSNVDLATLHHLSKFSAGNIHYYENFQVRIHGSKLSKELSFNLASIVGWEALVRFRVSRGLKISNFFGHFHLRDSQLLVIPQMKSNQTITVTLEHEEELTRSNFAFIQCSTLFTGNSGDRKLRIHTFAVPITSDVQISFKSLNPSVTASLHCQNAIEIALNSSLSDSRSYLHNKCKQIVSLQPRQNSKPLELFIMLTLGMLKSIAFIENPEITADLRIYHLTRLETLSLELQLCYFYPILLPLHNLSDLQGYSEDNLSIILPPPLHLTHQVMSEDGAYLLNNGETILLWLGRALSKEWMESVFNTNSIDFIYPDYVEANIAESTLSLGKRVNAIINELRRLHGIPFLKVVLVKQFDPLEQIFFMSLIEDQTFYMRVSLQSFLKSMGYHGHPT